MKNLIKHLETIIGQTVKKPGLIEEAMTHRSFLNEAGKGTVLSNERLEFLGDAILQEWVSRAIFNRFPHLDEGKLTSIRTHLVRTETLAKLASQISLNAYLRLSKGEEKDGGRHNQLLLANCFEALIAAISLSNGTTAIDKFFLPLFTPLMDSITNPDSLKDSKSLLQENVQSRQNPPPKYTVVNSTGPDHHRTFTVRVFVGGKSLGEGQGTSKQEAEEVAAENALVYLGIKR